MLKTKKVLCLTVVIALLLQLCCFSVGAAAVNHVNATFDGGTWSENTSRTTYGSLEASVYGKSATDYCAKSPTGLSSTADRFFQALPNDAINIPLGGKLKISVDIAANTFECTEQSAYGRYISMKLNGTNAKFLYQINDVSIDKVLSTQKLLKAKQWNNITAIFEFNSDNTSSHYTLYINNIKVLDEAALAPIGSTPWTSLKDIRIGGWVTPDDLVYQDNVVVETYEAADSVAHEFSCNSTAKSGNEDMVDGAKKNIALENMDMTVDEFKAATENFVVLASDGNAAQGSALLKDCNVYATFSNGINNFYEKYSVSKLEQKTICVDAGFDNNSFGDVTVTQHYSLVGGVFGKAADDYCAKAPTGDGNTDRLLGLVQSDAINIPLGGKLKISVDVAANTFECNETEIVNRTALGRYIKLKLNNTDWKSLYQSNNTSFDKVLTPTDVLVPNSWNNITGIFNFNTDNTATHYTLYINGVKVYEDSALSALGTNAWTSFNDLRVGGIINAASDKLYYDNIIVETYRNTAEAPTFDFETDSAAKAGYESLVDATNQRINLEDAEMTVGDFKSKTDNFMVLDENGALAQDSAFLANSNVFAVYSNESSIYYAKYALSINPPIITGLTTQFATIIDNDEHTIRLVDTPKLTANEFIANTQGATVVKFDGGAITDSTLLRECKVTAVLGSIYNIEYTYITSRSYATENENFDKFTQRTSTGKIFENSGLTWTGHVQNADNVTFMPLTGLGGKAATDISGGLVVNNTTKSGTPMVYVTGNPYYVANNEMIKTTFTMEAKVLISEMNENVSSFKVIIHGREALSFEKNGTIKCIAGTTDCTSYVGEWQLNTWIPIAVTYHKGVNSATTDMEIYVNGTKIRETWVPGLPYQNEFRFVANCAPGATCTMAVDDLKLYSDSLEISKYSVADNRVEFSATESLKCIPIIAKYDADGKLVAVIQGTDSKSISAEYSENETVKAMLWESVTSCKPIIPTNVLVDRGNPVNAYRAAVSKAFSNGMVLQRDMPVRIWGTSEDPNGSTLNVSIDGNTATAYVNDGTWQTTLPAMTASNVGKTLTVTTAVGEEEITDVLIGDVYYIGGQSNAYFRMSGCDTYSADRASFVDTDNIRFLHQEGTYSTELMDNPVAGSKWESANNETIGKVSAIGAYFAKELKNNNVTVPIGLVQFAHNGTSLHYDIPSSITSKYTIDYLPERISQSYNAMLAPVEKFAAKGLIWYQGENDSIQSIINKSLANYPNMFKEFITYLKGTSGNSDLKVFTVQLSSHSISDLNPAATEPNATLGWNIPRFRAFQYDLANEMGDVFIIPSLDYGFRNGDTDAAHPVYKKPIGQRIANAALYAIYNQKTADNALAPMVQDVSFDNEKVTVTFNNVGTGLKTVNNDSVLGFEIINGSGQAVAATATITGTNTVVIEAAGVQEATGVRYAFYQSAPRTVANLENSNSIPCLTFARDKNSENGNTSAAAAAISRGEMLNK